MFTSFILERSFLLMSGFFFKSNFANVISVSFGILNLQVVKQPTQTGLNSSRNSLALSIQSPQAGLHQAA